MAAIAGYKGVVKGQTGAAASFSQQACTDIGSPARTVYRITDATKRFFDPTASFTVERSDDGVSGWTTVSATLYTITHPGGVITFSPALANPSFVRISGYAYPMAAFAQFRQWSGDVEVEMLDTTTIGGGGSKAFIPGKMSGTFSVEGFWVDGYFFTKLTTRAICALSFMVDANGGHYDCYAYADKLGLTDAADATADESVDFQVTGVIAYYAS